MDTIFDWAKVGLLVISCINIKPLIRMGRNISFDLLIKRINRVGNKKRARDYLSLFYYLPVFGSLRLIYRLFYVTERPVKKINLFYLAPVCN